MPVITMPKLVAMFAIFIFCNSGTAQNDLPPSVLLLAKIKQKAAKDLGQLPALTCVEEVIRTERRSARSQWHLVDSLHLDVGYAGDREVFSWPADKRFSEREVSGLVGAGLTSAGEFIGHARNALTGGNALIRYAGDEEHRGRRSSRFDYTLPALFSGYRIGLQGASAIVAIRGSFWADTNSKELLELTLEAVDIPTSLAISAIRTRIDYGMFRIGHDSVLLPELASVVMTESSGLESRNQVTFTHCRRFASSSELRPEAAENSSTTPASSEVDVPIPSGLTLKIRLMERIASASASIGDSIQAVIDADVKSKGRIIVPKGALVAGRLRMMEHYLIPTPCDKFNVPTSSLFWSPDGSRLAWINYHQQESISRPGDFSIPTFDLKTGATKTLLPASLSILTALVWLADGRLIYSQCDPPHGNNCNLWELRASRSGDPTGEPLRLTNWADFRIVDLNANAGGKLITFLKFVYQSDVYLGRLEANKTRMQPPKRLTLDERNDSPTGWTSDSKTVLFQSDRTGTSKIYKQDIDKDSAEAIVPGPDRQESPRLTPDGSSVLYLASKADQQGLTPFTRLMGVPISGGQPHQVLSSEKLVGYRCADVSSGPCILVERAADQGSTIYLLDPIKGKGRELYHTDRGAGGPAISPDGRHLAFVLPDQQRNRIRLLSIEGAVEREVLVKDVTNLTSLNWSSDGKGFFCGKLIPEKGSALLFIELNGNTHELWRQPGTGTVTMWGVPSPDGKYVAIRAALSGWRVIRSLSVF